MHWFKILLIALFSLEVVFQLVKTTGWRPQTSNTACAIAAVMNTLIVIGIWAWL